MNNNDCEPQPDEPLPWNPIAVRDLVRDLVRDAHEHPARLHLEQREADADPQFLAESFGEEALITVLNEYYLGLVVGEEDVPSALRLEGHKGHDEWVGHLPPLWSDGEIDILCA